MRRTSCVVAAAVLVSTAVGCGVQEDRIDAVNDDMTCAEVAAVIATAIARGTTYVGLEESDESLSIDLVFALSGAEERPECVSDAVRSRANGLRATIVGS